MTVQGTPEVKLAVTDHPIHELIQRRWSPRAFADKPVAPDALRQLFEAARWSASSSNLQPWSFLVARRQEDAAAFERMVDCLMPGNVPWASQAPVLVITVANLFRKPEVRNRHAYHDVGMATQNLAVQATALDLYLHLMGGFSPDKAREAFAIPEDHEAVTMFALGYLGDPAQLADNHREGEQKARERKPLSEFVFGDAWGKTAAVIPVVGLEA